MSTKPASATHGGGQERTTRRPLLDLVGAGIKRMIVRGKERYVTYDELNDALPPEQVSSEQIEDTMAMLSEIGISVVEAEESEEGAPLPEVVDADVPTGNVDERDGAYRRSRPHVPARDGQCRAARGKARSPSPAGSKPVAR